MKVGCEHTDAKGPNYPGKDQDYPPTRNLDPINSISSGLGTEFRVHIEDYKLHKKHHFQRFHNRLFSYCQSLRRTKGGLFFSLTN